MSVRSGIRAQDPLHPRNDGYDLFFGIRGGGGNFGVVTSFEFRLHPVDTVVAGPLFWPIEALEPTLRWYREWLPRQPEEVYAFYLVARVPEAEPFPEPLRGRPVCGLMVSILGTPEAAEAALEPAFQIETPLFEHIAPLPYPALQSLFDRFYRPGLQHYFKGHFIRTLSDGAIAEHVRHGEPPTPLSCMHLYPIDGAVHRVKKDATVFYHRDATWSMVIVGCDPDPRKADVLRRWSKDYWEALEPYSAGSGYVNFMMNEEGDERLRATYGENYPRLRDIKAKYDPTNLFHVNQNIPPAAR